jgi:DNA-binding transcriptional LysR family regulator
VDTQSLLAFVAVAETGSFSLAAERLRITQPAVSKRVAALELALGTRLFDRIGRSVSVTERGNTLLPRANRILREMADAERCLRDIDGAISGKLGIGTSHHVGLHRLPPVLRQFARRHPEVELEIRFMDSEKAHEAVAAGRLELAVVTLDPEGDDPRLTATRVWDDPLSVMVARDHPLAGQGTVDVEALSAWPAVLPGPGTYTGQILQSLFAARGVRLNIGMSTNYLETLRMLAAIGLGWSVLPDTMLTSELVRLEFDGAIMQRELGHVVHRGRSLSNAARALLALLDAEAAAQGA